jgi:hypothetical protein
MRRLTVISIFVLAVLLSGFLSGLPFMIVAPVNAQGVLSFEVVFTVGVGDQGIHYEGAGKPETLVWGPAALAIGPDGSFWIADTPGNRLLHYTAKGLKVGTIDLTDMVVAASDLKITTSNILVLDTAAMSPKVVRLALDGTLLASYAIPSDHDLGHGLSGIAVGDQGEILLERADGAFVSQLVDASGKVALAPLDSYIHHGRAYAARPADLNSSDKVRGHITVGTTTIQVEVPHTLGGLRILGVNSDESLYVIVDELETAKTLQVDETVRHYDVKGQLLGMSRIPIAEQYTYVAHALVVGPDSAVYAALTRADHVEIVRLKFSQQLEPILPPAPTVQNTQQGAAPQSCVYRDTMIYNAWFYLSNSKYLSSTNTDGACSGRGKPHYLGGAGTYSSVPYDWGGADTVAGFNGYMYPSTYQAGDIDTAASENCSRGVDCSGYVQQIWQLAYPPKYSTCTLPNVSTLLASTNNLVRGDIMNRCGVHTALFSDFQPNGMDSYEATTYSNYDRVVYMFSNWSRFSGYEPRKFNNVCPGS